jgi:hypothetical protein
MTHFLRSAILTLLLAVTLPAADPFSFTTPTGWRPERIPFPLGFAPELKYRGFEELRFGPGMFKPGTDTYWTYVFFWWIEGDQAVNQATLEKDLLNYYRGLSRAVGGSRGLPMDPAKITVEVHAAKATDPAKTPHPPAFTGALTTYDAFVTGKLVRLNFEVSRHHFKAADRTWLFFCVSPQKQSAEVWNTMRGIRDSFTVK